MKLLALLGAALLFAQGGCLAAPESKAILALPSGTIIDGIGTCDLAVTTSNEKARTLTKQGFALIHCFWFNEAVRSFRDATKLDPTCAAAWLGLNVALTLPWHTPATHSAEAEYAIKRAVETCGDASDLEQGLVAAFRLRSANEDDRDKPFEKAMMQVISSHPDSFEPRLLLSGIRAQLCMNDNYDAKLNPRTEMTKVLALISPVLAKDPNNAGALHYRIHALEGSEPERAVDSADRLGKVAFGSGHMVHMPGHIYNRVGLYDKARASFKESVRIHEEYAKKIAGANANIDWNYSHDLDFLIFNLGEMGRIKEAEELLKKNSASWEILAWRAGQWKKLAQREQRPFFVGMAAAENGRLRGSRCKQTAWKLRLQRPYLMVKAAGSRRETGRRKPKHASYAASSLSRQGKYEQARAKLAKAVDVYKKIGYEEPPDSSLPTYETQGMIELEAGHSDAALAAYQNGLKDRPNSGWMLYGSALLEQSGRKLEAARAYLAFLKAWSGADEDLPQMVAARKFLK